MSGSCLKSAISSSVIDSYLLGFGAPQCVATSPGRFDWLFVVQQRRVSFICPRLLVHVSENCGTRFAF